MAVFARHPTGAVAAVGAVLMLSLFAAFTNSPKASAWNALGCEFAGPNIRWAVFDNDQPTTNFASAAQSWNDSTIVAFNKVEDGSTRDMRVRGHDFGNTGWSGITYRATNAFQPPRCNANGHWVDQDVAIAVNHHFNDNRPANRRGVAVHEFGHALGLAHNNNSLGSCPGGGANFEAIMYFSDARFGGNCGVFNPQLDDRQGANALY